MRDLILVLADSKRMLGTRYAEWILGAPELEAGIACASMAQDEWGHGRLLYALLKDFGDDVERLEHGREPAEYRNMETLDQEPKNWTDVVVLNALADTALTIQLEALRETEYAPLRQRIGKLLDEEVFHAQHGTAWARRLAAGAPQGAQEIGAAIRTVLPQLLRWFGPGAQGDALRERFLQRISSLLSATGQSAPTPSFNDFDPATRRTRGKQPDERTIRRVRGDKNRQFLMD